MHRPGITVRHLESLIALADTGGFTRAASRLGVSQPSVSQQIGALEAVIGAPLVERGGTPMLTPLGREVLERARRILLAIDDIETIRGSTGGGDRLAGTIRLGVSPTLGAYIMPRLVARLHRDHPSLKVHVREGHPDSLTNGLAAGDHDIILVQLPIAERGLHIERLFRDPLYLAMATDHPLHARQAIEPEDLRG